MDDDDRLRLIGQHMQIRFDEARAASPDGHLTHEQMRDVWEGARATEPLKALIEAQVFDQQLEAGLPLSGDELR